MARVAVGSVSLAVAEWPGPAKGPAVVCIHGLTANHTCWASVADVLSPAHRLIAYDLRGRGESDKPDKGYSLAIHADDLEGLLDHFGLKKAVLIGHSLGAHIAVR
ncbi:MAG: alpha/beta fold hydrolase, partial [Candidatus Rokuibacteriota bacterium]